MNSDQFVAAVNAELRPVLEPLGYRVSTKVSGRAYDAECATEDCVAIISFEPGDDFLLVAVVSENDGVRSSLDDRTASPRLGDLNRRYLEPADVEVLELSRRNDTALDPDARKLVAAMRQLCLVLPRYVAERRATNLDRPLRP